jgi:hypothetical protein
MLTEGRVTACDVMGVKLKTSAPTLDVFNYRQSEIENPSRSSGGQTVIK